LPELLPFFLEIISDNKCKVSNKCKVMHLGKNNPVRKYYVENGDERVQLGVTEAEKDLGVIITSNGKTKLQAEKAIHRENHELGTIETFKLKVSITSLFFT